MSSMVDDEVLFKVKNECGLITLNRPKALNALNLNMVQRIHPKIDEWQKSGFKLIMMDAAGEKAFCAGGDIRAVVDHPAKGSREQSNFFFQEYRLNNLIGTLKIPYLALIDGITMGGGVGLSVHGKYRVATEHTMFAMPETGIGLFPDVGGSYFLPKLSGQLGMYLALTGNRLKGKDCQHAGIATHMCQSVDLVNLKQELMENPDTVEKTLAHYNEKFPHKEFSLESKMGLINKTFCHDSIEDILDSLDEKDEFALKTKNTILRMSPMSLKVTFRQLREGKKMDSLENCLKMEYRLARRCCEDKDFTEGVRAVLIDKDNKPAWKPAKLSDVTKDDVDRYFSPVPDGEWHY